jgi:hypothetical protein
LKFKTKIKFEFGIEIENGK